MQTRHRVDTSMHYDHEVRQPEQRMIELTDVEPVPERDPPLGRVWREPYRATPQLRDAVNLAIALGRPLLLQGDPGAGKTRLAYAIAYALGLPLETAFIKSTSRGQDLLYTYDAVRRLYDVQLNKDAGDVRRYVRLGPLGRAIARASYGRRSVVLIDEIDKADIDFPNDLLQELDRPAFTVPEAPELRYAVDEDEPGRRPIVIVTNNEEKTLPGAFLRRCIFHHVEFPSDVEVLDEILELHGVDRPELRERAIDTLVRLRAELDLTKKPGLSELLDWVGYLQAVQVPLDEIGELPYRGALIKQHGDLVRAADWRVTP